MISVTCVNSCGIESDTQKWESLVTICNWLFSLILSVEWCASDECIDIGRWMMC